MGKTDSRGAAPEAGELPPSRAGSAWAAPELLRHGAGCGEAPGEETTALQHFMAKTEVSRRLPGVTHPAPRHPLPPAPAEPEHPGARELVGSGPGGGPSQTRGRVSKAHPP